MKTDYTGKFTNNTSFDEGVVSFPLTGVIEGWQIGIPLIKQGGKVKLIIPPYLAYGCNDYRSIRAIPCWYLMWNYWKFSKPPKETNNSFRISDLTDFYQTKKREIQFVFPFLFRSPESISIFLSNQDAAPHSCSAQKKPSPCFKNIGDGLMHLFGSTESKTLFFYNN